MLRVLMVVVGMVGATAWAEKTRFELTQDQFDDVTRLRVLPRRERMKDGGRPEFAAAATLKRGQITSAPSLSFWVVSKKERLQECTTIKMLLDGVPVELADGVYGAAASSGGVLERLTISTNVDQMAAIAAAKKVEVKLCTTEFTLQESDQAALREMVKALHFSGGAPEVEYAHERLEKLQQLERDVQCNIKHHREATAAVVRQCGRYLETR